MGWQDSPCKFLHCWTEKEFPALGGFYRHFMATEQRFVYAWHNTFNYCIQHIQQMEKKIHCTAFKASFLPLYQPLTHCTDRQREMKVVLLCWLYNGPIHRGLGVVVRADSEHLSCAVNISFAVYQATPFLCCRSLKRSLYLCGLWLSYHPGRRCGLRQKGKLKRWKTRASKSNNKYNSY